MRAMVSAVRYNVVQSIFVYKALIPILDNVAGGYNDAVSYMSIGIVPTGWGQCVFWE